jgi:hypothetical protein
MTKLVGLLLSLPTEELFTFNEHNSSLNYSITAEEQKKDSQLQEALKLLSHKYKQELHEDVP